MMDRDCQATIGAPDVYINSAMNFTTSQCDILFALPCDGC